MKHWTHFLPGATRPMHEIGDAILQAQSQRDELQKEIDKIDESIKRLETKAFEIASSPDMWTTQQIALAKEQGFKQFKS